jgi:hypothetical protein
MTVKEKKEDTDSCSIGVVWKMRVSDQESKRESSMQKWQINGTVQWLCEECAKANSHVFLLYQHQWLGEEKDLAASCDCCRCKDVTVARLGKLRWLLYPFLCLAPRQWPAMTRAVRRAK